MINKKIPAKYSKPILAALSSYPELERTHICFKLTDSHPVPYGTTPTFGSLFKSPENRKYYITLLEKAKEPEASALFKNLPEELQTAVIAHELIHVLQFQNCTSRELLKTIVLYLFPPFKKKIERTADIGAIQHGFGSGLYKHALHLRSIPGYLEQRPEIDKYYLKPDEILAYGNGAKL